MAKKKQPTYEDWKRRMAGKSYAEKIADLKRREAVLLARHAKRRTGGFGAVRTYDNGSFYSVSFGEDEVRRFRWPASGLGALRSVWAQFDRRNGDLVDLQCNGVGSCERFDGPALLALTHDMQCAATKKGAKSKAPREHCRRR